MKLLKPLLSICLFGIFTDTFSQSNNRNIDLLGRLTYPYGLSNLWGYADSMGNEYAIVGTTQGVSIVDVTQPDNPTQLFFFPGEESIWREPKVWNKHAYIATDKVSEGIMIIDLSKLPGNATSKFYITGGLTSAHTLFIDENGYAYIFGSNKASGGAVVLDLSDPANPVEVGSYNLNYIHDGYVRNDTLWAGEIYKGWFSVIDFTDKSNPVLLATQTTPGSFTHNCWLSDNGKYIFTTDEVDNSYLTAYNITDLSNITEISRYQSNPGSNSIGHNTIVRNDFLITAYYRDGVTLVDANDPNILIEVGNYDTSPLSGTGFNGCWGAYPFLPSGNIIANDIEEGLFVLKPTYTLASFVYGTVTDSVTGNPVKGVTVRIENEKHSSSSDLSGNYKTGGIVSGLAVIIVFHPGYFPKRIENVTLISGISNLLNIVIAPKPSFLLSGNVTNEDANVVNCRINISNNEFDFSVSSDLKGNFTIEPFYSGIYQINAGTWGYITQCIENKTIVDNQPLNIVLKKGYFEDFNIDNTWTVTGNATTGKWERGIPVGTNYDSLIANPDNDANEDCGGYCLLTGNGGGSAAFDDVDNGKTIATSPTFDATKYVSPEISFYRWFFNEGGFGDPMNDSLIFKINNGIEEVMVDFYTYDSLNQGKWVFQKYLISDYLEATSTMNLIFEAVDAPQGHIVEAGVDLIRVRDTSASSIGNVLASNPSTEKFVIRNISKNEFELINISDNINHSPSSINMYDVTGKEIQNSITFIERNTLRFRMNVKPGLYFLKLQNNSEKLSGFVKFVVF